MLGVGKVASQKSLLAFALPREEQRGGAGGGVRVKQEAEGGSAQRRRGSLQLCQRRPWIQIQALDGLGKSSGFSKPPLG